MARGGSRPGAGRPRLTDEERAQRNEARNAKRRVASKPAKAKKAARKPTAAAGFAPDGVKTTGTPQGWPFGTQPAQPEVPAPAPPASVPESDEPVIAADTPLELLLGVVKDPRMKLSLRIQCSALAAPFVHAKPAPVGKKQERAGAAKKVGQGRFAAAAAPLALVKR